MKRTRDLSARQRFICLARPCAGLFGIDDNHRVESGIVFLNPRQVSSSSAAEIRRARIAAANCVVPANTRSVN
jgi:hypothetical protein